MSKVAMTFARGWGVYNAGETAGFDADQAEAMEKAGVAVRAKDQPKEEGIVIASLKINIEDMAEFKEARASIEAAAAELEAKSDKLDARDAALDEREARLDAREAALADREAELRGAGEEIDADGVVIEKVADAPPEKPAGLPKQGR